NGLSAGLLNGVHDLTISADSTHAMNTTAKGGAATGTGAVSSGAQAAIAISNVTTKALLGTGAPLALTGKLAAAANQKATVTTKTSGDTKGGNAAIGLSLALSDANHEVEATLGRDLNAGGDVSFTANGQSTNENDAKASATGADAKTDGTQGSTDNST